MMRLAPLFVWFLTALPAVAQAGWAPTHLVTFGPWTSICEAQRATGVFRERCFLLYTNVVTRGQDHAFVSLSNTPRVTIGLETYLDSTQRNTRVGDYENRLTILSGNEVIWQQERGDCRRGRLCGYQSLQAEVLLAQMRRGDVLVFEQFDRNYRRQTLYFDLTSFSQALDDLEVETRRRGL
ncbi:MAG: hypothetical protein KJO78_10170 [Alphaproteobacteria bacterium]|nr:hypothetical protein [Alphaproteobacteria bacterium]